MTTTVLTFTVDQKRPFSWGRRSSRDMFKAKDSRLTREVTPYECPHTPIIT